MHSVKTDFPGLAALERHVRQAAIPLPSPHPPYVLFFAACDGLRRAKVKIARGSDFASAWQEGINWLQDMHQNARVPTKWLRVDWPTEVEEVTWNRLHRLLARTKRNYFRLGLALDEKFDRAFTEQELNANAMLYGGNKFDNATLNEGNFALYVKTRFPHNSKVVFTAAEKLFMFFGEGAMLDQGMVFPLYPTGRNAGRRVVPSLNQDILFQLIGNGASFLARQVGSDGRFVYGYHPCFDRTIDTYNTLRHASSTYAMVEACELVDDRHLRLSIERAIRLLVSDFIVDGTLPNGDRAAFLKEDNGDIKLGGNALALLALCKYATVFQTDRHRALMDKLAMGIEFMQDPETGHFKHVYSYPELELREEHRTIYYEGEAAFALMRFFELSQNDRWLKIVEKAFDHFITDGCDQYHDHWLAYSVDELTKYLPREEYFRFALDIVSGYLNFVETRITTFPTLLELMMATQRVLRRLDAIPNLTHLVDGIDRKHFARALQARSRYLLNGHFWPEYAMFMRSPDKIVGSFFIRHHAFRVRIDDVEHYLSGLIALYTDCLVNGKLRPFRPCSSTA